MKDKSNLIWIDLEMTGLDTQRDHIIEIATIVTDKNLNILADGPSFVINQPKSVLNSMDDWNTKQHGRSGLFEKVSESTINETQAEKGTLKFLEQFAFKGHSPMCGNSICQDRRFLANYMPALEDFFHYRNLDVSSVKELVHRWKPDILGGFVKKGTHEAMDDIKDSVAELIYYREHFIDA